MIFPYLILCWAIPLTALPKQWKLLLPAGFGPALINLSHGVFPALLYICLVDQNIEPTFQTLLRPFAEAPNLVVLMLLLGILCCFCRYKAYADAAGRPFRAIFGKGTAALGLLFLLTYGVSLGMAYFARCRTERHVAELEKFFGHPVSAQGMKELYYQGRKPDAAFWKKALAFMFDFETDHDFVGAPAVELPPAELAEWRKAMERSSGLRDLESMFETEPPACERDFRRGEYFLLDMSEYHRLRIFVYCEVWRVRFAVADRNAAAALAALDRIVKVRDHLARDPEMAIPALVLIFVENQRMDALERLLSSDLLSDPELEDQRKLLAEHRQQLPGIHARTVYGEAVQMMDLCDSVAYGVAAEKLRARNPDRDFLSIPAFYGYRWLFPAGWYVLTGIRDYFAVTLRSSDFTQLHRPAKAVGEVSTAQALAGLWGEPEWESIGKKFHSLTARCLAMETLIGIELEKRRTGRYPEKLGNPPLDPFGRPLLYKHGKVPFIPIVWDKEVKCEGMQEDPPVMVDAVAVWSRGPDGVDDRGLKTSPPGERSPKDLDDLRALRLLPADR